MRNFQKIADDIDVSALSVQLDQWPELWDLHTTRKTAPGTPHADMSDIWVRFRPRPELVLPQHYAEPHFASWYPAADLLPDAKRIALDLMGLTRSVYLGGVLITRLQPGATIKPHHDRGGWHAEFHNCKVYVPVRGNSQCVNRCEDEAVVMAPGEAWTFDNLRVHSVENNGASERITMIVCMRTE